MRIDTENVQVVVKITGRDAFPVWVLPYVTGWSLSIDILLDRLANPHYESWFIAAPQNDFDLPLILEKQSSPLKDSPDLLPEPGFVLHDTDHR